MIHQRQSIAKARPVSWLISTLAACLAWLTLYMPYQFQQTVHRYVYPHLRLYGLAFVMAALMMVVSTADHSLPKVIRTLSKWLWSGVIIAWGIQVSFLPQLPTGDLLHGLLLLVTLATLRWEDREPDAFRWFYLLFAGSLGGMMLAVPRWLPASTYGSIPAGLAATLVSSSLLLALAPKLAIRRPWIEPAAWLFTALSLSGFAMVWTRVSNVLGVTCSGALALVAFVWAAYLLAPWHFELPGFRARFLTLTLVLAVLPIFALGAVSVDSMERIIRTRELDQMQAQAIAGARILDPIVRQQQVNDLGLLTQLLKDYTPYEETRVVPLTDLPTPWPAVNTAAQAERVTAAGERVLIAYVPCPEFGFGIIVERPLASMTAVTAGWSTGILLATLATALIAVALSLGLLNPFVERIVTLRQVAVAIANHRFNVRAPGGYRVRDEMTELSDAINDMARTLEAYDAEVKQQHREVLGRAAELEGRSAQQALLVRISQQALACTSLDDLLQQSIEALADTFEASAAAIFLLNETQQSFVCRALTGGAGIEAEAIDIDQWPGSREALVSDLPSSIPSPVSTLALPISQAAVAFRIAGMDRPYGLLILYESDGIMAAPGNCQFVQTVCNMLATAVEQYHTAEQLQAEMSKREQERGMLRAVLDVLPVGVAVAESGGQLIETNQAFRSIWGPHGAVPLDQQPMEGRRSPLERVLDGAPPILGEEIDLQAPFGERHTVLTAARAIRDDAGTITHAVVAMVDITDRKRMEEALRESEALLIGQKQILEQIAQGFPLALIHDAVARFIERHAPDCHCAIQLLNQSGTQLQYSAAPTLPAAFFQATDRMAANGVDAPFAEVIYGQIGFEALALAKDHRFALLHSIADATGLQACVATPMFNAGGQTLGVLTLYLRSRRGPTPLERRLIDTAVFLTTIAVERSRNDEARSLKLESLIRHMVEGTIVIDRHNRVVMLNPIAQQMLRLTVSPQDRALDQLNLPGPLLDLLRRVSHPDALEGERLIFPFYECEYEAHVTPVVGPTGDTHYGVIALLRDVTAEAQFRRIQENFVANVSHELRGPLATISATLEAISDGVIPEPAWPQYLQAVLAEVGRLRRLSLDVTDLYRLDAGAMPLRLEELDLQEVFVLTEEKWRQRYAAAGVALRFDTPPITVWADSDRVQQVLTNLLDNAVRFTPDGGSVHVRAAQTNGVAHISVVDTGIGIPSEALPYVWERFYKVDTARTLTPDSGTGLGLSIVRQLVEQMDGRVSVFAGPAEGAVFGFTLPAVPTRMG